MQTEVNAKMSGLAKGTGKTAFRLLWKGIRKMVGHIQAKFRSTKQQKAPTVTHGKTTMKKLSAQDRGMKSFELPDSRDIARFDRIMKRYGVDYAVKKDVTGAKVKPVIFFKSQDADAFTLAFKEFSKLKIRPPKPSVTATIQKLQEQMKAQPIKEKTKELVR